MKAEEQLSEDSPHPTPQKSSGLSPSPQEDYYLPKQTEVKQVKHPPHTHTINTGDFIIPHSFV